MSAPLRLGTRASALARWQAAHVQALLHAHGRDCIVDYVTTAGDRRTDVPLAAIGGKGLFTQDIEAHLLAGELDVAVHSLKDVPAQLPAGLVLGAALKRADPRDALIAAPGMTLTTLPARARLGTSSLRRQAQALALRPDLQIVALRGNVDTRLRRWREGAYDALLLAVAGLERLELADAIAERLDPTQFVPAAGQGVLVLECRAGDTAVLDAIAPLHHPPTAAAIAAERAFLRRLNCGCQSPVAAYAQQGEGKLYLDALVAKADGTQVLRQAASAAPEQAEALGIHLAETLLAQGAASFLG
ncbi:MAG: hydroxymethylbilane synthase [Acidobacteria bacterium]|nr:MAG: hydroxymethylbilane synthase [Acidobacteriota bacterium]